MHSLGNIPLNQAGQPPPEPITSEIEHVHRHKLLGGRLNHYERKAGGFTEKREMPDFGTTSANGPYHLN